MLSRGERFYEARQMLPPNAQSMSRVEKATGVSKSLIQSLEDDDSQRDVGYTKIISLATHYGVSTDWLLGLSDFKNAEEKQKFEGYHLLLQNLLESNTNVYNHARIVRVLESVITGFSHALSLETPLSFVSTFDLYTYTLRDVASGLRSWMKLAALVSSDDFKPSDDEAVEIYELRFSLTNFMLKAICTADGSLWSHLKKVCPDLNVSSWSDRFMDNVDTLIKNHTTGKHEEAEA